jgi:phosphopantetheinyl transferase
MITVYIKRIENVPENEKQNIINSLSAPAQERLNKKRNDDLYLASLGVLSILNTEQRADLDYTENGNPYFKSLNQDISISHSKYFAAVAISTSRDEKVGIDIENVIKANISTRFFTESEKQFSTDALKFLEIWTRKEALFKFLKNDSTPFIHLDSTTPEKYGASFATVQINDYIITICKSGQTQIEIIQI